jgi:hypothetical protein
MRQFSHTLLVRVNKLAVVILLEIEESDYERCNHHGRFCPEPAGNSLGDAPNHLPAGSNICSTVSMTLAELRYLALVRGGRASVNGVPHVPGSEVTCPRCWQLIEEASEVVVGIVGRNVTVGHLVCSS